MDEFLTELDFYIDLRIEAQINPERKHDLSETRWKLRWLLLCLINKVNPDGTDYTQRGETRAEQIRRHGRALSERYGQPYEKEDLEPPAPLDHRAGTHKR
jgi:hypothetical protein